MVYIVNHSLGDRLLVSATDSKLDMQVTATTSETTPTNVMWDECTETERQTGFRVRLQHPMVSVSWMYCSVGRCSPPPPACEGGGLALQRGLYGHFVS